MKVTAIKTHKITEKDKDILKILDRYLKDFNERNVLTVSSKIVSICEGSVVPENETTKQALVENLADYFIPKEKNKYGYTITITDNTLISAAGIDLSNGNGYFVLWPKDSQKTANQIREYLIKRFNIKYAGVIITDSAGGPLRKGIRGFALAHSGFAAINTYIGQKDLFGYSMRLTNAAISDGLAAAAMLTQGEGDEQNPMTIIEDVPFIKFQGRNPIARELAELKIPMEEDIYVNLLKNAPWQKGRVKK